MILAGSPIAAWDNASRGLDSATALDFVKALRVSSNVAGVTHAVALYQASQGIYDLFDMVLVLYDGRQIFFGSAKIARQYFIRMGYMCPQRQTTGDFLTSVTSPCERIAFEGHEKLVPRIADEFEAYWFRLEEFKTIQQHTKDFTRDFGQGEGTLKAFRDAHREMRSKHT